MPRLPELGDPKGVKITERKVDRERGWDEEWGQQWRCPYCSRTGLVTFFRLECQASNVQQLLVRDHHAKSPLCIRFERAPVYSILHDELGRRYKPYETGRWKTFDGAIKGGPPPR